MTTLFHDPAFWGFATAVVASVRYVARVIFLYKIKAIKKKADLDLTFEGIKSDNLVKSVDYLNGVIARIEPMVKEHELAVHLLHDSIIRFGDVEKKMGEASEALSKQFVEFKERMNNVQQGGQIVLERLVKVETEIIDLKSGNIYVKNKKQT